MRALRRASVAAIAASLASLAAACGSGPGVGTNTCSGVSGSNHAWVIVVHSGGRAVDRCVGFDSASISGATLMKDSKLAYSTQSFGSLGVAFCSVDNEPRHYAGCLPANSPYWSDWLYSGGSWKSVTTTFDKVKVAPGGALGWVYTSPTGSPPPPPAPPAG
jgi:hypothetical protein